MALPNAVGLNASSVKPTSVKDARTGSSSVGLVDGDVVGAAELYTSLVAWHTGFASSLAQEPLSQPPGIEVDAVVRALQADLAARGHLHVCVRAQVVVLVTMIGLDISVKRSSCRTSK